MANFIKSSIRELKHVVWPTRAETKKYFMVVVSILVLFGIYLFLASTLFTKLVFGLKNILNPDATNVSAPINIENNVDVNAGQDSSTNTQTPISIEDIKVETENGDLQIEAINGDTESTSTGSNAE